MIPMTSTTTRTPGSTTLGAAYWRVWWANAVSSVGDGAFVTALPLLAVTLTTDPRRLSLVSAAFFVPWLVFSLPAGALVDRHERATLMWRAQAVQGLVVAVIAVLVITRTASIGALVAAGFCLGTAEVVFSNAAQAVLPQLVPAEQLPKANGNLQVSLTVGETFIGPPVGSVLFALTRALPFGLDAVSFAGSAVLLSGLPRQRPPDVEGSLGAGIAEGMRWLLHHRLLRGVAMLLGVLGFCNQMGQAVLVLLATRTLHIGARGYGLLWTTEAVGSVLGGLANPAITKRLGQTPSLILAVLGSAVAGAALGLAPNAYAAGLIMAVNGFAITMWNVVTVSLRQRIVPARLLGRVNSAYRMLGWGLMPLGALTGGFVAHAAGLRAPYVIGALVSMLALAATLPALLKHDREQADRRGGLPRQRHQCSDRGRRTKV